MRSPSGQPGWQEAVGRSCRRGRRGRDPRRALFYLLREKQRVLPRLRSDSSAYPRDVQGRCVRHRRPWLQVRAAPAPTPHSGATRSRQGHPALDARRAAHPVLPPASLGHVRRRHRLHRGRDDRAAVEPAEALRQEHSLHAVGQPRRLPEPGPSVDRRPQSRRAVQGKFSGGTFI